MHRKWNRSGHRPPHKKFRSSEWRRPKHNVPVNLVDNDDHFEAWVYCVSFDKSDITITVVEDVLYISGQRQPEDSAPNFMLQEYPIKGFERIFELSPYADKANITARMDNGILKIHVPKTADGQRATHDVPIE